MKKFIKKTLLFKFLHIVKIGVSEKIWQLRRTIFYKIPIKIKTKNGSYMMNPSGHIAKCLFLGSFEKEERSIIEKLLKPGMTCINIGANSGVFTLLLALKIQPHGTVHSFEPSSSSFSLLEKNVSAVQDK